MLGVDDVTARVSPREEPGGYTHSRTLSWEKWAMRGQGTGRQQVRGLPERGRVDGRVCLGEALVGRGRRMKLLVPTFLEGTESLPKSLLRPAPLPGVDAPEAHLGGEHLSIAKCTSPRCVAISHTPTFVG